MYIGMLWLCNGGLLWLCSLKIIFICVDSYLDSFEGVLIDKDINFFFYMVEV